MSKFFVVALVGVIAGCSAGASAPGQAAPAAAPRAHAHAHDPADHNHDRGRMMVASNGVVDALLTAHLSSREGHELDVFVERGGAPVALEATELRAKVVAGGEEKPLAFTCAPRDERPEDEPEGTCSHFVAKAPWIDPSQALLVRADLPLRRGPVPYAWRAFQPLRYAHHVD